MRCRGACSAFRPPARDLVFLTYAGLVLEPDFYCRPAHIFSSSVAKPLFKRLQRLGVLRMVAGPRRELDVAELLEFKAHGRFVK